MPLLVVLRGALFVRQLTFDDYVTAGPEFNGSDYDAEQDKERLTSQIKRIFELMRDGVWRTLSEIEEQTGAPAASASAQLRHLRKPRFGAFVVEKRSRGERSHGLYEYRVIV